MPDPAQIITRNELARLISEKSVSARSVFALSLGGSVVIALLTNGDYAAAVADPESVDARDAEEIQRVVTHARNMVASGGIAALDPRLEPNL